MTNEFERLREQLRSVDSWLDMYLARSLRPQDRALAVSLQEYVMRCQVDKRKWRSEKQARRANMKIERTWMILISRANLGI
jgi:hypothetical protein